MAIMKTLTIITLSLLLFSCKPTQVIERETSDTTIIKEVVKLVHIPAERIESPSVNLDSLVAVIKSGVNPEIINRTLNYTDPETKSKVGLILDQMGNLTALCEVQERQIELLEKEVTRLRQSKQVVVVEDVTFWKQVRLLVIGLLIGVVGSILVRILI